ncbi:MAG: cobalamin-binding protein [Acidobacteriota bacterium]
MSTSPRAPARRIVSLTCSNTEIVAALGCGDRLVGVDDHSDYPAELLVGLPRVGPDLGIDVEAVAALQPDLVLASLTVPGHEKVVAAVEAAGLPFIAPAPTSLDEIYRDIREIGGLLDVAERAEQVAIDMAEALEPFDPPARRPTIAVQWWPKPVILPGRKSWVHDLIERAGGRNLLGDEAVESRPVPDDELARLAPDAIVLSWCGVEEAKYRPDVVAGNPAFAEIPAVRDDRIVSITEAWLGRPSPRLVDGYRALRPVVEACLDS